MPIITVPKPLREKLGDEGSDALVQLINQASESTRADVVALVGERFERRLAEELSKLRIEMGQLRAEVSGEVARLRAELRDEIGQHRGEVSDEFAKFRAEMGQHRAEILSQIAKLRTEVQVEISGLRTEMARFEARIIRWMFIFWIGQIGAILGILFAFFRQ